MTTLDDAGEGEEGGSQARSGREVGEGSGVVTKSACWGVRVGKQVEVGVTGAEPHGKEPSRTIC